MKRHERYVELATEMESIGTYAMEGGNKAQLLRNGKVLLSSPDPILSPMWTAEQLRNLVAWLDEEAPSGD